MTSESMIPAKLLNLILKLRLVSLPPENIFDLC